MKAPVHIVLRQSPDWAGMSDDAFREQARAFCRLIGRPEDQVVASAELWDRTYRQPYREVRQRMKEIAAANLAQASGARFVQAGELARAGEFDGRAIYVFIDDDDWVDPRIAPLLADAARSDVRAYVWGSVQFGTGRSALITRRPLDGVCHTNNYAIAGEHLAAHPEQLEALSQHWRAEALLRAQDRQLLQGYWSMTNKNPTSTVYLEQVLQGRYDEPRRLTAAIEDYLSRCSRLERELDPPLAWSRPFIERTIEVFAALRPR